MLGSLGPFAGAAIGGLLAIPTGGLSLARIKNNPTAGLSDDYAVDTTTHTNYVLHTKLENTNEVLKDGIKDASKPAFVTFSCYIDATNNQLEYCLGPN